tara:strand:- start:71 stop:1036 length:966 start_codon:yes stop_codon:yes gene_type:complete
MMDQLSTFIAITTSILAKRPELLIETKIASQLNIQNYYSSFSKEQEREADLFAIEKLNDLKISTNGLENFLNYLKREYYQKGITKENFIYATHPYFDERLAMIYNYSENNHNSRLNENMNERFFFIKAKLFGFTEKDINYNSDYLKGKYLEYSNSIILANNGRLLESLEILNKIIKKEKNNFYLYETKADLLYNHGYTKESYDFYKLALLSNKDNLYIKQKLFNIDYNNLTFKESNLINDFFQEYEDLIFLKKNSKKNFLKWSKIFSFLDKKYWHSYVNAKIDLFNSDYEKAKIKFDDIIYNSNNSKLINASKKEVKKLIK